MSRKKKIVARAPPPAQKHHDYKLPVLEWFDRLTRSREEALREPQEWHKPLAPRLVVS